MNEKHLLQMPARAAGTTYTLRLPRELLDQLHFVASYNGRSANMEIVQLIKKHIAEFEAKHGKINE